MKKIIRLLPLFILYLTPSTLLADQNEINDPLEEFNRCVFNFNNRVDSLVIKPIAKTYDLFLPEFIKSRVSNFLQNLTEPIVFLNAVLQADPDRATKAIGRFLVNISIGLGGIHDVARETGLRYEAKFFDSTLAYHGAKQGIYIVLPLLGSSSTRGVIGLLVDNVMDPFNYFEQHAFLTKTSISLVDKRRKLLNITDDISKISLDEYATYRSLYHQRTSHR